MTPIITDDMREQHPHITDEIRAALIKVALNPTIWPCEDADLRALLINDNWAQPHCWIDIFDGNKLRYEWRLCFKGEAHLHKFPASIDEITLSK